ncbi:MAG TPA: RagB/SusD family nutrient uptake outer membrane protein [Chitinophaga sp.]|uniref:RagB/SusD family nutrient uptake outer membrane protein n=1 Tax=Chitinophaga sp. TaxID=1869181 RepID=UPI002DBFEDC7|nr:RagB/SusD family nutrient uptake outer membrane protein [Chitinophaga sp.]HEU4552330.1 RagB/SusD family nutrient uptake outer membrane protein [Chitinophaga sp.]
MKPHINEILLLVLMAAATVSCKKQLEEYNPGGATVESLFKTPEGFEAAVTATYTYNRSMYGKEEGHALLEAGTDIWTNAAYNGNTGVNGIFPNTPLTTYQGLISDNLWVNTNLWVPCYAAINLCNTALKYINNAGLSESRKPVLEGELRFMRAWYYYHLAEAFGPVNFTLEPTESMVTEANRTPVDKIYEQIFADVQFAAANLPNTTSDYGRATKPVAEAFLARLNLVRGNNQAASNYARSVIENYGFSLLPKYADLWKMENEKNAEIVWALNYSTNLALNGGSNVSHSMYIMDYINLPGMQRDLANGLANARWMPTRFLLDLFNENNDARFSASFKQAWICNNAASIPKWSQEEVAQNPALAPLLGQNKFAVGDTAVFISKYSIDDYQQHYTTRYRYKTYDRDDVYNTTGAPKDRFHYISLRKFEDPTRPADGETQSARNVFLIRLAEMYLITAEAQMKLGRLDSAALYVNAIRKRAALPGKEAAMEVAPSSINIDFILDERARELAGEQLRWFDLKRTGKLVERVRDHNPDAGAYIQPFHDLRPIPQAQLDAVTNKSEFQQNEGY